MSVGYTPVNHATILDGSSVYSGLGFCHENN